MIATEKLTHQAVASGWVNQLRTVRHTILVNIELPWQTSYMVITDVRTHLEMLVMAYMFLLQFNILQIRLELKDIRIEDCHDDDTDALQFNQKVNNGNQ